MRYSMWRTILIRSIQFLAAQPSKGHPASALPCTDGSDGDSPTLKSERKQMRTKTKL